MPRPRKSNLETPSARAKLAVRKGSYFAKIAPGISLGYRRNQGAGVWSVRATDGHGREWLKKLALSDDLEPAAPPLILTYWQAVDEARKLARGQADAPTDESRPVTLAEGLSAYERDLTARGAKAYNARWPKMHLTSVLLSKPVSLLGATELRKWRDGLIAQMKPATVNRLISCVIAALNLAADHDRRIQNRQEWQTGLQALPDANEARNIILTDQEVRAFVAAAYAHDAKLGEYVHALAETGSRPSQVARLLISDLIADPHRPKLMMPKSGKGGGRNRVQRKAERISIAITPSLCVTLQAAAAGRDSDEPLLLQSNRCPWGKFPSTNYDDAIREVVASIGLDPREVTMYSLRHSSICRQLLRNVPVRVVASSHDTSVTYIEANYSRYITEHADEISRAALLDHGAPVADNVVALAR
jgi:integrase